MNQHLRRMALGLVVVGATQGAACTKKPAETPAPASASTTALPAAPLPAPAATGVLSAAKLINDADVARVVPAGSVRQHLAGVGSTSTYDGLSFTPPGKAGIGLTVQWWKLPSAAEAQGRYQTNFAGYPGAKTTDEVGQHSFRATGFKRRAFVFLDLSSLSVVALTCGDDQCLGDEGDAKLATLAKSIQTHLGS